MDYKYIEQLLDRYFAAETTQQEEQILKSFYAQNDSEMPASIRQYAPLFEAMMPTEELGSDFDERMMTLIGEEEKPVVKARVISLGQRLRPLFSAAAVVAILLTLTNALNLQLKSETTTTQDIVVADYNEPAATGKPAVALEDNSHMTALPVDSTKSVR